MLHGCPTLGFVSSKPAFFIISLSFMFSFTEISPTFLFLSSGQFLTLVRIRKREVPFFGRNLVSFETPVLGILRRPG
jgi:hypothetical protein